MVVIIVQQSRKFFAACHGVQGGRLSSVNRLAPNVAYTTGSVLEHWLQCLPTVVLGCRTPGPL